jgi:hypothetical protein
VSTAYDVSGLLQVSPSHPFGWWARCCGQYTAVDDAEHCATCVPPLEEVLRLQLRGHLDANLSLTGAGVSPQDPEAMRHLEAALAALHLARQLAGVVTDPEDEELDPLRDLSCSDLDRAADCA